MMTRCRAGAHSVSSFGRRVRPLVEGVPAPRSELADDLRLFALTFAAGFLFMAVYLG
jgi:hypothetical protein